MYSSKLRNKKRSLKLLGILAALITLMLIFIRREQEDISFSFDKDHFLRPTKRGMEVVVGHFIQNVESKTVITEGDLNRNGYSPVIGLGEMGEPVQLSPSDAAKAYHYYDINKFNLIVSDRISVNRSLPDVRNHECKTEIYNTNSLPSTSVIIVFHNEAWSTLLRTVHSVINRSTSQLLREIILVDDASEREFLKEELDTYVAQLPIHVIVLHIEKRVGLIKARLNGASIASGQVLTFLDAHCECTTGWLEPLLYQIYKDRTSIACPVIDVIHDDTFAYTRSFDMHWGAFNWNLHFRWFTIGEETMNFRTKNIASPFKTPIMAGGLFAISKSYFNNIGSYDAEMDIWGGENIELSFRVWQCGGSIKIVPCSHVGHIFRKSSPYSFPRPGGISKVLTTNLVRVAEVWMDDWKQFFYSLHPEAQIIQRTINVTERLLLRKRLNCKPFLYFLNVVWPEHFFPTKDATLGKIRNTKTGQCLRRPKNPDGANPATGVAATSACNQRNALPMMFIFNPNGYIMSDESVCLDVPNIHVSRPTVYFLACRQQHKQKWKYQNNMEAILHLSSKLCLDQQHDNLILSKCTGSLSQKWTFEQIHWR